MNKEFRSTTFFTVLCIFILAIAGHNFVRYHILKDYPVSTFTECDPEKHNCFLADIDTSDPTFQTGPYAKVEVNAAYAPSCLDEHTCSNFSCDGIAGFCDVKYCTEDSVDEGETCSNQNL